MPTSASPVGLYYGRQASRIPAPKDIVMLFHEKYVSKMWLPEVGEPDIPLLTALDKDGASYKMEVVLCIGNSQLKTLEGNPWVEKFIQPFLNVNFTCVCVGDASSVDDHELLIHAISTIRSAIHDYNKKKKKSIKVSTIIDPFSALDSYNALKPPSTCNFNDTVKKVLKEGFSDSVTAIPLFAKIIPYFEIDDKIPLHHYLFTSPSYCYYMKDEGTKKEYKFVYDAMVDSIYSAVQKLDFDTSVDLFVTSGWPTSGSYAATLENAKEYNSNLAMHVNVETPMHKKCVDTYIYSLIDEDKIKINNLSGEGQEWKHFGCFVLWCNHTFPGPCSCSTTN